MPDTAIYYFNARHATEVWTSDPDKMVDGVETQYAYTTDDGDIQLLTGNNCPGTDLGTISKVELQAYAYADDNDQLGLRPVFPGGDGDTHWEAPGVTAGWKTWWDITNDPNNPGEPSYEHYMAGDIGSLTIHDALWVAQTFTPSEVHTIKYVQLKLSRYGYPGTVTVGIRATDGNGHPTGGDLASGTIDGNSFTSDAEGQWYVIAITDYSLSASTKYAIVVRALNGSPVNACQWRYDGSGEYTGGNEETSNNSGVDWTTYAARDCMFDEGTTVPAGWTWATVQSLDCDVEQNDVSKGNTMHCGEVQIRVTYEPSGPPPAGQPARIRTWGIPTGPGIRHGGSPWN